MQSVTGVQREVSDLARPASTESIIEQLMPIFDYVLILDTLVPREASAVYASFFQLQWSDVPPLDVLSALRRLRRTQRGDRDKASAAASQRLFELEAHSDRVLVESTPDRELALGLRGRFWTQQPFEPIAGREDFMDGGTPDLASAVFSLRLEEATGGTRAIAETRLREPSDPVAARKFRSYWRAKGGLEAGLFARNLLSAIELRTGQDWFEESPGTCAFWSPRKRLLGIMGLAMASVAVAYVVRRRCCGADVSHPVG